MNCVVICCDTFRYDALAGENVNTPNLDRLKKAGTMFTRAFAEGLPTIQARRTMFTGRRSYPWRFEMDTRGLWPAIPGWHRVPSEQKVLAEILLDAGYTTGFVSDTYHMFKSTQNFVRGFSSWDYIRGQESDNVRSGPRSKVDISPYHPEGINHEKSHLTQYLLNMLDRKSEEDYLTPRVFRSASRWLEDNTENAPFFLWVDSFAPHEYWDPPMEFPDMYFKTDKSRNYILPQWLNGTSPSEDEIRRTRALYFGYVTFVDKWIGRFLDKLEQLGLREDTLILFTSDHGTELWDRDRFGKGPSRAYAYNTQVPLVIADPESEQKGGVCDRLVQHLDILPTICTRLGVNFPDDIDGIDLGPVMRNGNTIREKTITAWSDTGSVRSEKWNLVFNTEDPQSRTELYDLEADPEETADVAAKNPEIVNEHLDFFRDTLHVDFPVPIRHHGDGRQAPPIPVYRRP